MDVVVRFNKDYEDHKSGSEALLPAALYWPLKQSGIVIRISEFSEGSEPEEPTQLTKKEVNPKSLANLKKKK
jgi:hypothetical protein